MDLSKLTDEELDAMIAQKQTSTPKPSTAPYIDYFGNEYQVPKKVSDTTKELIRQLGLTARGAISGPASFLSLVGDPLNLVANVATGSPVSGKSTFMPVSQAFNQLLGKDYLNLPEPKGKTERIVQDVVSAGSGVGSVYKAAEKLPNLFGKKAEPLKDFFTMGGPSFQTAGGGAAALAVGAAREGGRPPLEQLAYGIGSGTLVPSGGAGAKIGAESIARGAKSTVQPFTEEGREVIVGNVLNQLARDPVSAKANIDASKPTIPGSMPMTAGASKDVGLASAEQPIRSFDATGKFAERISKNNEARRILLGKFTDPDNIVQAEKSRDTFTSPLRETAFKKAEDAGRVVDVDSILEQIETISSGPTGAREAVNSAMKQFKSQIESETGDVRRLDSIRQNINDYIQGKIVGSKAENFKLAKGELTQLRNFISDEINKVAPGYRNYLKKYSELTKPIEQQKKIREIEIKSTEGGQQDSLTGFETIKPVSFRKAVSDKKDKLKGVLTKTQLATLQNISRDIDLGLAGQSPAVRTPGSPTFKNFSVANVIGDIIGKQTFGDVGPIASKVTLPLQFLYNAPDQMVQELLIDAMLDPKLASKLLGKATQKNVEAVSDQLQEKAKQIGFGQFLISTE